MHAKSSQSGRPWERQYGETEPAFIAFLFYRNLGPSRSIDRAYRQFLADSDAAEDVPRRTHAPGNWGEYSVKYEWVHRAREWDVWRLRTYGHRVATLYTWNLERALERQAEAVERFDIGDDGWESVLATFDTLGDQLEMVCEGCCLKTILPG